MIKRFQDKFNLVKESLLKIHFYVEEEEEYNAIFGDRSSWKIDFSGDKYSDVWWINLRNIDSDDVEINRIGFSINYLMKVIDNNIDNKSIKDELSFLINYKNDLFNKSFPYKKQYDELNKISDWLLLDEQK